MRTIIYRLARSANLGRLLIAFAAVAVALYMSSQLPVYAAVYMGNHYRLHLTAMHSFAAIALIGLHMIALSAAWPIAAYLVNIAIYLVHRILWPILPRLIYAAQRFRVVQNRELLTRIAVAILLASDLPPFVVAALKLLK